MCIYIYICVYIYIYIYILYTYKDTAQHHFNCINSNLKGVLFGVYIILRLLAHSMLPVCLKSEKNKNPLCVHNH